MAIEYALSYWLPVELRRSVQHHIKSGGPHGIAGDRLESLR